MMNPTMYDRMKVKMSLGDVNALLVAANVSEIRDTKIEKAEKKNAELVKECETQAKEIGQLRVRIMEAERGLTAWKQAERNTTAEQDAAKFLAEHSTSFEGEAIDTACDLIRALLKKCEEQKPSPLLKQRIENAADVLRQIESVPAYGDGTYPDVAGDRFNAVHKTLRELYDVAKAEVL